MSDRTKYLNRKTAKGRCYLYFRSPTGGLTQLPLDESSAEFRIAYDACMRALQPAAPVEKIERTIVPGDQTLNAAIVKYKASSKYDNLKPNTRRGYGYVIELLRERLGPGRLADLDCDVLAVFYEEIESKAIADRMLIVVSRIFENARKFAEFEVKKLANPTLGFERQYKVKNASRPWSFEDEQRAIAAAPDNVKLGILMQHFAGQRGGDGVKMQWTDLEEREDENGVAHLGILVRPQKTNGEAAALPNWHRLPKVLREAVERAPRQAETILVNERGKPYANAGVLSNAIRRALKAAGIKGLKMHGLRSTLATDVAELGAAYGVDAIMSMTGHRDPGMAAYYAKEAQRTRTNHQTVEALDAAYERRAARQAAAAARRTKLAVVA